MITKVGHNYIKEAELNKEAFLGAALNLAKSFAPKILSSGTKALSVAKNVANPTALKTFGKASVKDAFGNPIGVALGGLPILTGGSVGGAMGGMLGFGMGNVLAPKLLTKVLGSRYANMGKLSKGLFYFGTSSALGMGFGVGTEALGKRLIPWRPMAKTEENIVPEENVYG